MSHPIYRFGEFELDPANRELRRGSEVLPLRRKPFDCLVYLVEHAERVVGRDELIEAVWKTVHLSDSVLGRAIFEMRRALRDDGEEPRYIKTVRGVGYRWLPSVESAEARVEGAAVRRPSISVRALMAMFLVSVSVAVAWYLWRGDRAVTTEALVTVSAEGKIALVLPVTVDGGDHYPWIRLGVMDLVAARLRSAGLPIVPSDTVIALLRRRDDVSDPAEIDHLVAGAGADLVFDAHAEMVDGRWRVSLRGLRGERPLLNSRGEAADVVEAARIAADRMALALGLTPAPEPNVEPGLTALLQQTEAAMLAQQTDIARSLIENAEDGHRDDPRLRLQLARIDAHRHEYEAARAAFETLLEEPAVGQDSVLRARALYGLGMIHFRSGRFGAAEGIFQEAVGLLDSERAGETAVERGRALVALGTAAALNQGMDAARRHLVRARLDLTGTGDTMGLAGLDNNLAGLEARQGRYVEALHYLERAARGFRALNDVGGELRARFNSIRSRLNLLEPRAAMAIEPRLRELMAQAADPALVANARLARAELLAENGRTEEAGRILVEVLEAVDARADLRELRVLALALRAEWAARRGDTAQAGRIANEIIGLLPPDYPVLEPQLARARLFSVRALVAANDLAAATGSAEEMRAWAGRYRGVPAVSAAAMLAEAEVAAASDRVEAAEAAFERALDVARRSRVPAILLHTCEAYAAWLLGRGTDPDPGRALLIASHLDGYADRHYDAAVLQLRAYHAAGERPAWRGALERAQSLAGERDIPPVLRTLPQ